MIKFLYNSTVIVTPEKAIKLLAFNTFKRQRPLNRKHMAELAHEMRAGRFTEAIQIHFAQINDDLILVNGQHTLSAIIDSGIHIQLTLAYYSCDDDVDVARLYSRFDKGGRTPRDVYRALGIAENMELKDSQLHKLYAALRFMNCGFSRKNFVNRGEDTLAEAYCWKDETHEFFNAVKSSLTVIHATPIMSVALITFRFQSKIANEFWSQVAEDDGLAKNDPRKILNKFIQENRIQYSGFNRGTKPITPEHLARAVATAWNAYFSGKSLTKLTVYKANREILIKGTPFKRAEIIGCHVDNSGDAA